MIPGGTVRGRIVGEAEQPPPNFPVVPDTRPCPACGTPDTDWEFDCPGYLRDGAVVVCYPPGSCGNATRYFCTACEWWYRTPNGRRGDEVEMGARPVWLGCESGE